MAVKVMMPKGSDTMTEGKVLKWLKKEGDAISTGDTVVEIETDKVDMEVEAMGSGVLRKILVDAGKVVPVGELLAVIGKSDEDISALVKPNGAAKAGVRSPEPGVSTHAPTVAVGGTVADLKMSAAQASASAPPETHLQPSPQSPAPSPEPVGGRVLASPLAKRMAKEMGLEIAEITGTGPNGRIIRQDVERRAALTPAPRRRLTPRRASQRLPAHLPLFCRGGLLLRHRRVPTILTSRSVPCARSSPHALCKAKGRSRISIWPSKSTCNVPRNCANPPTCSTPK